MGHFLHIFDDHLSFN